MPGARSGSWRAAAPGDPGSAPLRRRGVLSGPQGAEWQIRLGAGRAAGAAGDSSAGRGCEVVNGSTAATVGGAGIGRWRAGLSGSAARRAALGWCRVAVLGGAGAVGAVGMRRRWPGSSAPGSVRSAARRIGGAAVRRKPAGQSAAWRVRSGYGWRGASGGGWPARPGPGRRPRRRRGLCVVAW